MKKNNSYSNDYKFKVALEMIRGDLTTAEIISKYQVPRSVLHKWKNQLLDKGPELFSASKASNIQDSGAEINQLHATIGKLKVENDFLQAASARLKL